MKKLGITALAALMALNITCNAEEEPIVISDISANNGRIAVEVVNNSESETLLTVTVKKMDDALSEMEKYYGVRQKKVKSGEATEFGFVIDDVRDGVPGSGNYTIIVQNKAMDRAEKIVDYADSNEIAAFIQELKDADATVTVDENAYLAILPVLTDPDNAGVYFSIGIDYEMFAEQGEEVQRSIANLLHYNAEDAFDTESFAQAFSGVFGLGIYNSGQKTEAVKLMNLTYNGEKIDQRLIADVVLMMDDEYEKNSEFVKAFAQVYGVETVNYAKVNTVEDVLEVFGEETGECMNNLKKIKSLSSSKRGVAYEYIVEEVSDNKLDSVEALDNLLAAAYKAAASSGSSGSSSSGGGGADGGVGNRTPVGGTSVSTGMGSGGTDVKTEALIFADMAESHWAAEAVIYLKNKGIVSGTDTGAFEPDRAVTREEFTKMIVLACGFESGAGTTSFADAAEGAWYVPYIGTAAESGVVKGVGNNMFGIGQLITRQDMAVMAKRALEVKEIAADAVKEYSAFADESEIAEYAMESVTALYKAGIINGKGGNVFDPVGSATRAEAAKIIYEAFKGGMQ